MKPRFIHHINFLQSITLRDCCGKILDNDGVLARMAAREALATLEGRAE
jgi:hypothetical protein